MGGGPGIRALWRFTTEKRKTEQVALRPRRLPGLRDGSKALYRPAQFAGPSSPPTTSSPAATPASRSTLGNMIANIDPRAEWKQMFHETWRIERDFLYDPNTHGLSIPKIEARNIAPTSTASPAASEFSYLTKEMTGEISIGHMFIGGPVPPRGCPTTGLLGADYTVENDRYKIAKILGGQNWTPGLASPLTLPGVYVMRANTSRRQRPRTARRRQPLLSSSTAPPASRPSSTSA
jgi:tricorn protease